MNKDYTYWKKIRKISKNNDDLDLNKLFKKYPNRGYEFNLNIADINFDFSKSLVNDKVIEYFCELANQIDLQKQVDELIKGEHANNTEKRSVGHIWLRSKKLRNFFVKGVSEIDEIQKSFFDFAQRIRSGEHRGNTGKIITDVVNIGIGGSDLGPAMVYKAMEPVHDGKVHCHFVSNIDESEISQTLNKLNPETTIVIITSKTFTTIETMTNAEYAKKWLSKSLSSSDLSNHLVAISTNVDSCMKFGVSKHLIFPFWDWVGGRYSLLSSVGLSIAIAFGTEVFENIQNGASKIDENLVEMDLRNNALFLHAAINLWNLNGLQLNSLAVIPYSSRLSRFPAFLQQLWMESNGKSVDKTGKQMTLNTCPVVFGEPGTNSQHSFFQMLHQGTQVIPVDFIILRNQIGQDRYFADNLIANALAQASVLAFGKSKSDLIDENTDQELINHKVMPGNRPSNILSLPELNAFYLGQLIAFYEASVMIQGLLLNINSFDQWGVELGKKTALNILRSLREEFQQEFDSSTNKQIEDYKKINP